MLLMGDEVRRTQRGNNNAYCQDSEISWFDWRLLERHADVHRFVKMLNAFRQRRDVVVEGAGLTPQSAAATRAHRMARRRARPPGLERALALARVHAAQPCAGGFCLHGMLNAYWEPLTFELPPVPAEVRQRWRRCIDTALASPTTSTCGSKRQPSEATYVAQARSVVILALSLQPAAEDGSQG